MASRKGRPTVRKDGIPLTSAERQARRRKRVGKSINRRRRTQRKLAKQDKRWALQREASRNAPPLPDEAELRIGDAREVLADIPDDSVALILTDPPYARAAEPLYEWLAEFAARVLIPGGSLICWIGCWNVPRITGILAGPLNWHWLCHMPLNGGSQRLFGKQVISHARPIAWCTKGPRRGGRAALLMPDVFVSPRRDKLAHDWAQGEGGVWVPIENLTEPGELIVDPFAGTATWGRIAAAKGRRWIGADIEAGGSTRIAA
jgi:hypothetical protein